VVAAVECRVAVTYDGEDREDDGVCAEALRLASFDSTYASLASLARVQAHTMLVTATQEGRGWKGVLAKK
jgi:hypothetical protein